MAADPNVYAKRWWITFTVMLVAVLEVLDTTIVNVSLPDMMGALSANVDQITWVLTSYIVSAAIVMPLTGFLVQRLGLRKLLLINIVGFMCTSMLCGLTNNLTEIVIFRTLQGVFGASLVPLSQFVLRETFPVKEQGTAMAIWGVGVMCAPVLGPTLGGVITEYASWRWIFYINVPICIVAYFMTMHFIDETEKHQQEIDWCGLILMALGIGCFQTFLDRGNNVGWYSSASIRWLTLLYAIAIPAFIWRCLVVKNPVVNIRLFLDRNFGLSTFLLCLYALVFFGQVTLSPIMLQTLFNYPSLIAGLAMGPRGIASMLSMAVAGRLLLRQVDARLLIIVGIISSLYGTYLYSGFTLDAGFWPYLAASFFQGFGMGLFFVPIATLALSTIAEDQIAGAAGLWSLSRNLGQSMGISIMATILSQMSQVNWNTLGSHITAFNTNLTLWEARAHLTWNPVTQQILAQQLQNQSQMIAFNDIAKFSALALFIAIPFVLLLQKPKKPPSQDHAGLH